MWKLLSIFVLTVISCSAQENYLETLLATVPNSATSVTTRTTYTKLIFCTASSAATLTITNTAGDNYFNAIPLIPNQAVVVMMAGDKNAGLKMVGIKWSASVADAIKCQIQGYQP